MLVLALDTTTRRGGCALRDGDVAEAWSGAEARTHGERLPLEAVEGLAARGRALADVALFAVVIGPGSFTGLRVGIATIQGWAMATGRQVVPVTTFEAVAHGWRAGRTPDRDVLLVLVDGQRGEVFGAAFDARGSSVAPPVLTPVVGPPDRVVAMAREAAAGRSIACAGDGARRYAAVVAQAAPGIRIDEVTVPLAAAAAHLAAAHPDRAVAPHALRPLYVRRPDAEIARDRARAADRGTDGDAGAVAVLDAATVALAAGPRDLADVEALQRETFTNAWGAEAIQWELDHTDVARLYVMRAAAGPLIGYCACWIVFDELHINSLAVAAGWRRRGAARRLLERVFADVMPAGVQSATLEVRRSNTAALRLYEGLGFRVEGTRRDYYQAPREDALILWRRDLGGS
ncbi:MAG: tRNA (adenosine(37)-N6)-threonylcarbamoyltransferase complex dimerization subunit type 1 TsaB [Vicinamibacterales bacterium]